MQRYPEPYADPHSRNNRPSKHRLTRFDAAPVPAFAPFHNRPAEVPQKSAKRHANANVVKLVRDKTQRSDSERVFAEDSTIADASGFVYPTRTSNFVRVFDPANHQLQRLQKEEVFRVSLFP